MKHEIPVFLLLMINCILFNSQATAQENQVVLKAIEGNTTIEGELIGSNATHYQIKTQFYGIMTVDKNKFSCTGEPCPKRSSSVQMNSFAEEKNVLNFYGSTIIGTHLIPPLVDGFAKQHGYTVKRIPGHNPSELIIQLLSSDSKVVTSIDIRAHGSSSAFGAIMDGKAHIGMSTRPAKNFEINEINKLSGQGSLKEHIIALDAITVIVSRSNRISSLTLEQIAKIFSGEIRDWSEVGGAPGVINVYSRDQGAGIFDNFNTTVLEPYYRNLAGHAKRFDSAIKLSEAVSADAMGIGYTGLTYSENAKILSISNECGMQRQPNAFSIKTEEYPLTQKLYLYTMDGLSNTTANQFLNYLRSREAEELIRSSIFIDQALEYMNFEQFGDRLISSFSKQGDKNKARLIKEFVETFQNSKRLSVALRFQPNSVHLDSRSTEQLLKVAISFFGNTANRGKIYLVGFSDSAGDFEQNRQIALLRAQQVKNTLIEAFGKHIVEDRIVVKSFGELLPVACNTTQHDRLRNRRVEVWVSQ